MVEYLKVLNSRACLRILNSRALPDLSLSVEPAYASFEFQISERALTMSPEKDQYIWRKTISHIEVGMGSGVFPV